MRHIYVINETGAGGWSKVKYLNKQKNILSAISEFNTRHSYSISTDTDETDSYYWRGSKYGIHSCYENDGRNGIIVAVILSKRYGGKLTHDYKINFKGRLYRLYVTCYSNIGSVWFTVKGRTIYVN